MWLHQLGSHVVAACVLGGGVKSWQTMHFCVRCRAARSTVAQLKRPLSEGFVVVKSSILLLYTLPCMHAVCRIEHTLFHRFVECPVVRLSMRVQLRTRIPPSGDLSEWWAVRPRRSFMKPALSAFYGCGVHCTERSDVPAHRQPIYLLSPQGRLFLCSPQALLG